MLRCCDVSALVLAATLNSWTLVQYGTASNPLSGQPGSYTPEQGMFSGASSVNAAAVTAVSDLTRSLIPHRCYSITSTLLGVYLVHSLLLSLLQHGARAVLT